MKACSRPDTQPERLTDLAAYLLRYLAARRAIQIQNRAGRHNAVGVDSVVAAVIVLLDVVEIYRSGNTGRSEEHTSELQSLMRISYAVFCLKKQQQKINNDNKQIINIMH